MGNSATKLPYTPSTRKVSGFSHYAGIWQIYVGDDGATLIFRHDKKGARPVDTQCAQNALKRMRSLRHPYILKLLDGIDNEEAVLMATEYAVPLTVWLAGGGDDGDVRSAKDFASSATWGLYALISALSFFTQDAKCIHGNLSTDSVYVTRGGDFKLGGFELAGDASGSGGGDVPERHLTDADSGGGPCPDSHKAPERASREWGLVTPQARWTLDAYSLGVCIWEVWAGGRWPIRGPQDVKAALAALGGGSESSGAGAALALLPVPWRAVVVKLLSAAPRGRPPPGDVLGSCEAFRIPLVGALVFLEELALKEPKDKARFFTSLPGLLPRFPDAIAKYRLLPALLNALEFGAAGGGGTVTLGPILDIGGRLSSEEYSKEITPVVVKLFASLDRATRLQLLAHLPSFLDKLSDDIVNSHILPSCAQGFVDTSYHLREATVKAALALAPRASPPAMRTILLPNLKKCLGDAEPGIRVNACICLGRMAGCVERGAAREELLPSFLRVMRDPFPHARAASLRAVVHCLALEEGRYWEIDTVAKKVMPAAAHLALDPFVEARSAAFALLEGGTRRLKEEGERLAVLEAKAAKEAAAVAAAAAAAGGGGGSSTGTGSSSSSNSNSSGSSASSGAGGGAAGAGAPGQAGYGGLVFSALGWAVGGLGGAGGGAGGDGTPRASGTIGDITVSTNRGSGAGSSSSSGALGGGGSSKAAAAGGGAEQASKGGWDDDLDFEAEEEAPKKPAKVATSLGGSTTSGTGAAARKARAAAAGREEGGEETPAAATAAEAKAPGAAAASGDGWEGTTEDALESWTKAPSPSKASSNSSSSSSTSTSAATTASAKPKSMSLKGAVKVKGSGVGGKAAEEDWGEW